MLMITPINAIIATIISSFIFLFLIRDNVKVMYQVLD